MSTDDDTFWDELGLSWRGTFRDSELISRRLETRLKLQRVLLTGTMALGAAVGLLGFALAAWTLWIGWENHIWNFLSRGATLAPVSLLAVMATLTLRMHSSLETRSLRELLQVSIERSERLIRVADLGLYTVLILAVGGTIGYALRSRFGRPPAMSLVEDFLVLIVVGLALAWYRRTQASALLRYGHLDQAFASGETHNDGIRP